MPVAITNQKLGPVGRNSDEAPKASGRCSPSLEANGLVPMDACSVRCNHYAGSPNCAKALGGLSPLAVT